MRVLNKHSAPLTVGRERIAPGAEAEISADAAKLAGVRAWLKSGKLVEAKAKTEAKASDNK